MDISWGMISGLLILLLLVSPFAFCIVWWLVVGSKTSHIKRGILVTLLALMVLGVVWCRTDYARQWMEQFFGGWDEAADIYRAPDEVADIARLTRELKYHPDLINSRDLTWLTPGTGDTPLKSAVCKAHLTEAAWLLAKGADINAKDREGTPLHLATLHRNRDMVALLLSNKADIHARDRNGETPLHAAMCQSQRSVAALLLAKGSDINAKDNDGETPLYLAVRTDRTNMVQLLLDNHAAVNIRNNYGVTPLGHAMKYGYGYIAALLLMHGGHE
jgi:hypothetical protein